MAQHIEVDPDEALEMCEAMDLGVNDGLETRYPGEPPPRGKPGEKAPEPLPVEPTCPPPATVLAEAVRFLDASEIPAVVPGLNLFRALNFRELLDALALDPADILPADAVDEIAVDEGGRHVAFLPAYFFPPILTATARAWLRAFHREFLGA